MTDCCGRGFRGGFAGALVAEACWLGFLVWMALRS
jgi:hypothetical protein